MGKISIEGDNNSAFMCKKDYPGIDLLKFVFSVGVIIVHVYGAECRNFSLLPSFLYQVLTSNAVPFFFLSSGYLCLRDCSVKRIMKIEWKLSRVLLLLAILYFPLKITEFSPPSDRSWLVIWFYAVSFINEGGYYHLWYLLSFIIILPIVFVITKKLSIKKCILGVILLQIGTMFLEVGRYYNYLGANILNIMESFPIIQRTLGTSLVYVMLGAILAKQNTNCRKTTILMCLCVIFNSFEIAVRCHLGYINDGVTSFVTTFLFEIALLYFATLETTAYKCRRVNNICLRDISSFTYYIHPFFLYFLRKESLNNMSILLVTVLLSVISGAAYHLFQEWRRRKKWKN